MNKKDRKIIAIDFDGTLTMNHNFPKIGKPRMWLINRVKKWKNEGHGLILWTCRTDVHPDENANFPPGNYLKKAVAWCKKYGLEFDAINESIEEKQNPEKFYSRKIFADFYIDDRSVCFDDENNGFVLINRIGDI